MPIPSLSSLGRLVDPRGHLRRAALGSPALARLLAPIGWDEAGLRVVTEAAARGRVVFVLRNQSLVDLVALTHLVARSEGVPELGFANELGWVTGSLDPTPVGLHGALRAGRSAVLFLRRPPRIEAARMGASVRGRGDGRDLLAKLLEDARAGVSPRSPSEGRITIVPLTFVWSMRPDRPRIAAGDVLLGPADFPGELRSAARLVIAWLDRYEHCAVRVGEPLDLGAFAAANAGAGEVSRLSYALLRRLERERRAVVGPAEKPADRRREEVLKSPKLQRVLRDMGGVEDLPALTEKARAMLAELEARPDPALVSALEPLADGLAHRVYSAVEVDEPGMEALREAARRGSVVLLPSHKSHVDYLVLAWLLRKHKLPPAVIAAGDNLSFFPAGPILRRAGAFFIRREAKADRLYAAVLDAYVRKLLRDGWVIEFFLEGGRSRSGKLLPPMLGLLNLVVEAALGLDGTPVSFVPVSIGYERAMEDRAFARELRGGAKPRESARQLLSLAELLREPWGRVSVQLGAPIELGALRAELGVGDGPLSPAKRRGLVARLAQRVMRDINRVSAVTPGALVATLLLTLPGRSTPHAALVAWCERLVAGLAARGARLSPRLAEGGRLRRSAVREAVALYARAGYVRELPGAVLGDDATVGSPEDLRYEVVEERRLRLDYAKNGIVHLFVDRALVAAALASLERAAATEPLAARAAALARLFQHELPVGLGAEGALAETLAALEAEGAVVGGRLARAGDGAELALFHARLLVNFFEGYRVAARALRLLERGPMARKDLALRGLRIGQQMFARGEIERSEAIARTILESALDAFVDEGWLVRADGKLALAPSFADEASIARVEARVARLGGLR